MASCPLERGQGAGGESLAALGFVGDFHAFDVACEDDGMVSDDTAAAQGMDRDLVGRAFAYFSLASEYRIRAEIHAPPRRGAFGEHESRAGRCVLLVAVVFEGGSVKTIEYPTESANAIDDHSFKRGLVGFIAGAALAMLIIFLVNLFDTRVKGAEELTQKYNLPVLGEIHGLVEL